MPQSVKSFILVFIQFTAIIVLGIYAGLWSVWYTQLIAGIGLIIGVTAITQMKLQVNVYPDVIEGRPLLTSGIYKFIRHPMYTSVLLVSLAWVLERATILSIIIWSILCVNLMIKIQYEEELLLKKFPKYEEYKQKPRRLIPYLL